MAKDPARGDELAGVLYAAAETLRILAILIQPIMPGAAQRLWDQLGLGGAVAACPDEQPTASAAAARSPSGASGRTLRDERFMFSSLCYALRSRGIREWPEGVRLGLIG